MPLEQCTIQLAMTLENVPANQDIPGQNVMNVSRDTLKHLMELVKVHFMNLLSNLQFTKKIYFTQNVNVMWMDPLTMLAMPRENALASRA